MRINSHKDAKTRKSVGICEHQTPDIFDNPEKADIFRAKAGVIGKKSKDDGKKLKSFVKKILGQVFNTDKRIGKKESARLVLTTETQLVKVKQDICNIEQPIQTPRSVQHVTHQKCLTVGNLHQTAAVPSRRAQPAMGTRVQTLKCLNSALATESTTTTTTTSVKTMINDNRAAFSSSHTHLNQHHHVHIEKKKSKPFAPFLDSEMCAVSLDALKPVSSSTFNETRDFCLNSSGGSSASDDEENRAPSPIRDTAKNTRRRTILAAYSSNSLTAVSALSSDNSSTLLAGFNPRQLDF